MPTRADVRRARARIDKRVEEKRQLAAVDLDLMTPAEIESARQSGLLDAVLVGETDDDDE